MMADEPRSAVTLRRPAAPLPPGSWLGMLGGGQLGRMFCMAAQSLGYRVCVLDPGEPSPAGSVADRHLQADYEDPAALRELAATCSAATTEFENVPAAALRELARHIVVSPSADAVAIAQARLLGKRFVRDCGIEVAPHVSVLSPADLAEPDPALFPGILKVARLGYDGKGQARVGDRTAAAAAWQAMRTDACVLEQLVPLDREVSVIVARTDRGETATWPVAENQHRDGILDTSIVPARVTSAVADAARDIATRIAAALDYRGILCVEMFVTRDGTLLVNEIAPRPHNSGHYSIDACVTSQFEQQARVLAGLPLGATRQHTPAVMVNLLGDLWFPAENPHAAREPPWDRVLQHPEAKLHLYGKAEPRRGRKMGHVTCLGATRDDALAVARTIRTALAIPGAALP